MVSGPTSRAVGRLLREDDEIAVLPFSIPDSDLLAGYVCRKYPYIVKIEQRIKLNASVTVLHFDHTCKS